MTQLDINDVVEEAVTLVQHEALRHGVAVRFDLASGLPPVRGDRIQLQQVIVNLAVNGMEAMATVDRERMLIVRTQRHQSKGVLVAIEDAGVGIEPENVNWFSTHSTRPNLLVWAWDFQSADRLLKRTADNCGLLPILGLG